MFGGRWEKAASLLRINGTPRRRRAAGGPKPARTGRLQFESLEPRLVLDGMAAMDGFAPEFLAPAAEVAGRHIFYSGSAFDTGGPADGHALATDKEALLPGGTASFANYTSYVLGINGIAIDVFDLGNPAALGAADFTFKAGNDNDPGKWDPVAVAPTVEVLPDAGPGGSDRIALVWPALVWPDGAVRNQWLEVTVLANDNTGLVAPDVFYFGNAIGETGNSPAVGGVSDGDAIVNVQDVLAVRNHPQPSWDPALIDNPYDFNRDQRVDAADILIARDAETWSFTALKLIDLSAGKAAGAEEAPAAKAMLGQIAVTEINYNPYDPTQAEIDAGFTDNDDFEFIELKNIGPQSLDLGSLEFVVGIQFDFDAGGVVDQLDPGEFVVVVRDMAAFAFRYGAVGNVTGEYLGKLKNAGEQIILNDRLSVIIQDFTYDDSGAWPGRADGGGSSLEVIDTRGDFSDPATWRNSTEYGGSPGEAGTDPIATIIVNEVITHTDPPLSDGIELYNTTGSPIDISGWWLTDASDNYQKFQIPPGTIVPAAGYLVFFEGHYFFDDPTQQWVLEVDPLTEFGGVSGFALSSAHGDDVWLISADAGGSPLQFIEHVDFGATENGVSLGRWPDGDPTARLFPMAELTLGAPEAPLGAANTGPKQPDLIISEVMYQPPDPDGGGPINPDDLEFIEIYNPSSSPVNLWETYTVFDVNTPLIDPWQQDYGWRVEGYVFAAGTTIGPDEALIVVPFDPDLEPAKATQFRTIYGLDVSETLLGPFNGPLVDEGEVVRLRWPDEPPWGEIGAPLIIEDQVDFQSTWYANANGGGDSLARKTLSSYGNFSASWVAAAPTPGEAPFATALTLAITEIDYNPHDPTSYELAVNPDFGNYDEQQYEFIELQNISEHVISLAGVQFVGTPEGNLAFDFSTGSVAELAPAEYVLVARNTDAFNLRYGAVGNLAGQYVVGLDNGGERIVLNDSGGNVIHDFAYDDQGDWPGRADGGASSLEVIDTAGDYADPANWRNSTGFGGSPGQAGAPPAVSIVVNEVLTNTDPPWDDRVELHNTTGSPIDINRWYLSDDNQDYLQFQVSAETVIAPGGYHVFTESELGFGLSSVLGDDVWIVSADGAGKPLEFIEHVGFGPTETGVSLGRWPDGTGRLFPMAEVTLGTLTVPQGATNTGPKEPGVIISELHYHPVTPPPESPVTEDELEFIELYNRGGAPLDVGGWQISGVGGYLLPGGTMIPSGGTLVVLSFDPQTDAAKWQAFWEEYLPGEPPLDGFMGGYAGTLGNAGETVQLTDPAGILVDEVAYDDELPWPTDADGLGQSLTRTTAGAFGNLAASWDAATPTPGAVDWQTVYWDGLADGNWGDLDSSTGNSRWVTSDGTPLTGYPGDQFTDAVVSTNTVTAGADRSVRGLTVESGGAVLISDGTTLGLHGFSHVAAGTTLSLGSSARLQLGPTTLAIEGDFQFNSSTEFVCEVNSSDNGLITATGETSLDGEFVVQLVDGYTAGQIQALGDSGTVVETRTIIQGNIAAGTSFASSPQYLGLDIFVTGEIGDGNVDVKAEFLRALPGDANGDRDVDFADFNSLANNYTGSLLPGTGGKGWRDGDFDGDGDVDFGDFNNLANNYTGTGVEYGPGKGLGEGARSERTDVINAPRTDEVLAHDAVLEQAGGRATTNRGTSSGTLRWLHEVEQIGAPELPINGSHAAEEAVDKLLVAYWP